MPLHVDDSHGNEIIEKKIVTIVTIKINIPCIIPEPLIIEGSSSFSWWSVFIGNIVDPFLFISLRATRMSIGLLGPAFSASWSTPT